MLKFSPLQRIIVFLVLVLGILGAAPNLVDRDTAEDYGLRQFNLGLDLQGGAHLLFSVDLGPVVRTHLDDLRAAVRDQLRSPQHRIRYVQLRSTDDAVEFRLVDPGDADTARSAMQQVIRDQGGAGNPLAGTSAHYDLSIGGGGVVTLQLNDTGRRQLMDRTISQSIQVIRRRIDPTGTLEAVIQRQGADRVLVQVPGVSDPEQIKRLIGRTAKMTFHMVDDSVTAPTKDTVPPPGTRILPGEGEAYEAIFEEVALDGNHLVDAGQSFDQGQAVVTFRFDTTGARIFCRITQENVGRRFAVVLDERVISAPVIRSSICGGSGIITGNFTVQSANELALLLRAGALPAPLTVMEERTVGPGLGQDAIDAGKIAAIIGLVLVVVFMIATYGLFGLFATVALVVNLVLLAAMLSLLRATLTLPGIAGIVLTIGMAVDANVLIFERIREEFRGGKPVFSAIDAGYQRAFGTIVDANLTTLIAAALLFFFGSGPVQGFGVTLMFGLVTSLFTAIMVTRLMVVIWWKRGRPSVLPI